MTESSSRLDQTAKIASILSSIAVPVAVCVFGWSVQRAISEQSLRKDYTDMALRVIAQADATKQSDLRQWAVDILDKNAPLPFSQKVRDQLLGGYLPITHQLEFTVPPSFMAPPKEWIPPPRGWLDPRVTGVDIEVALRKNYIDNRKAAEINRATLVALQASVVSFQKLQHEMELQLQDAARQFRKALDSAQE